MTTRPPRTDRPWNDPIAAWTPDAPDHVDSPSEAIAAGQPSGVFDPESLDHFESVDVCGALFAAVQRVKTAGPAGGGDEWYRVDVRCEDYAGHWPDSPHNGEVTWGGTDSVPAEPSCPKCADVGVVTGQGEPCDCPAGEPFRNAAAHGVD